MNVQAQPDITALDFHGDAGISGPKIDTDCLCYDEVLSSMP